MSQHATERIAGTPDIAQRRRTRSGVSAARHQELMLDEAIDETFPASDPPASSYPGSSLYEMAQHDRARRRHLVRAWSIVALLVAAGLLVGRPVRTAQHGTREGRT